MFPFRLSWLVVLTSVACWAQTGKPADDEAKKKIEEFKQAYHSNDESARAAAVNGLAQVYAPSATKVLVSVLGSDTASSVRAAAAEALGRTGDDLALQGLAGSVDANKKSPDVLKAVVGALVACDSERGLDALHSLFNSWSFYDVASQAVDGAGKIGSPSSIPALLGLLRKAEQERDVSAQNTGNVNQFSPTKDPNLIRLIEPCHAALRQCSGADAKSFKEWDAWWKKNQGSLKCSQVFWCPGTRKTFEVKPGEKKLCPHDGDKVKDCGVLLKRKVAGGN